VGYHSYNEMMMTVYNLITEQLCNTLAMAIRKRSHMWYIW